MSPNDMSKYRKEFDIACISFGWKRRTIKVQHERDWNSSWSETIWVNDGKRLFSEDDLEEGLVQEIIRISKI